MARACAASAVRPMRSARPTSATSRSRCAPAPSCSPARRVTRIIVEGGRARGVVATHARRATADRPRTRRRRRVRRDHDAARCSAQQGLGGARVSSARTCRSIPRAGALAEFDEQIHAVEGHPAGLRDRGAARGGHPLRGRDGAARDGDDRDAADRSRAHPARRELRSRRERSASWSRTRRAARSARSWASR